MQKLLFLLSEEFSVKAYDFVPYKYGCFSFQSYADKRKLSEAGFLFACDSKWHLAGSKNTISPQLTFDENHKINLLHRKYSSLKGNELIRYVYTKYPYYAIRSEIAGQVLNESEMANVARSRPVNNRTVLYTIGYEGKSLEAFINKLIREDVRVLCDVRRNPLSMKYGFSKSTLKKAVESIGIAYMHFPELGIESDKRKNLNGHEDYKALFTEYGNELETKKLFISELESLLTSKKRIALTCFEAEPAFCHRTILAKRLRENTKIAFDFKEI
jgi:uncharacterized protein (DUF488 family)